jgi:acyl-ACP thioesterase
MNNTRYLDWVDDLLDSDFHREHPAQEFTVCYLSEAREGDTLDMQWDFPEENLLLVDGHRNQEGNSQRIFSAKFLYE